MWYSLIYVKYRNDRACKAMEFQIIKDLVYSITTRIIQRIVGLNWNKKLYRKS